jgi:hypothetical protein
MEGKMSIQVNGKSVSLQCLIGNADKATEVLIENCPALTALPALPAATEVWIIGCPDLTER